MKFIKDRRGVTQRQIILGLTVALIVLIPMMVTVLILSSKKPVPDEPVLPKDETMPVTERLETDPATLPPPPPETKLETKAPETTSPPETEGIEPFVFPEIYSRCALLAEADTGRVLAEKNADKVTYCASITKIMTVLVAMERIPDTEATFCISASLRNRLYKANAAVAGFGTDEMVKAIDLMYAALLPSGADGSVGLAEMVAGSEEAFADMMNIKAAQLGMKDSHFVNASGLHDDEHVTTCRDLLTLLRAALERRTFRQIFTSEYHTTSPTAQHPSGLKMRSTMFKYLEENGISRDYFLGGKTGYTGKAGVCLASLARIGGSEYILITLGAGTGSNTPQYQVQDAVAVFDALTDYLASDGAIVP